MVVIKSSSYCNTELTWFIILKVYTLRHARHFSEYFEHEVHSFVWQIAFAQNRLDLSKSHLKLKTKIDSNHTKAFKITSYNFIVEATLHGFSENAVTLIRNYMFVNGRIWLSDYHWFLISCLLFKKVFLMVRFLDHFFSQFMPTISLNCWSKIIENKKF